MQPYNGVKVIQGDINNYKVREKISKELGYDKADLVCCDAVPDFIGDRFTDHMNSVYLNHDVIESCHKLLRDGGAMLMKIMEGPYTEDTYKACLDEFQKVQRVKPNASRNESKEIYFLCTNYGNSENITAKKNKELEKKYQKLMSGVMKENSPEAKALYDDLMTATKEDLSAYIKKTFAEGKDLPKEIVDIVKKAPPEFSDKLPLENKMSIREKQKARRDSQRK